MRITEVDTYSLRVPLDAPVADSVYQVSNLSLAVVRLRTDQKVEGWGYAWNSGAGAEFIGEMIDRYMKSVIVGRDPMMRKKITSELFSVENFGWDFRLGMNGIGLMAASAVDVALWDIICKKADLPLWKVIGGYRERVEAYNTNGGWLSLNIEQLVENSKKLISEGYRAIKIKVGSPNPEDDYERLSAVRSALGNSTKIMIDANTKWDLETAIRRGRRLDDFNPYWLEEPINPLDIEGHSTLRKKITTPIAVGESIYSKLAYRDYIIRGAADIIQVGMTQVAGITEWLEVASLAEAFNLDVYPSTNVQQPTHVQLAAATRNARMVEHVPWMLDVWKDPLTPKNGFFELPSAVGAGTEVKEEALSAYATA